MSSNLVEMKRNKPFTTTLVIAKGTGIEHRMVVKNIINYKSDEIFCTLKVQKLPTKGRPINYYELDETQASFLLMLMDNNPVVVKFKSALAKEFTRMKQVISALRTQHADDSWQIQRKEGKYLHARKTDVIKQFVDYATAQGSKNAQRYYANLAKMENAALFFIEQKYPNLRDILDTTQLFYVGVADDVVEKALKAGMVDSLHYKDCYKLAKERVEALAAVIGKSPVHRLLTQQ